jgi:hypothetical protein
MEIYILLIAWMVSTYFLVIRKSKKEQEPQEVEAEINEDEMFSVENFNAWWNDTSKPIDIYAHPGIFLRTDKLSQHHFEAYFESFGVKDGREFIECDRENWFKYKTFEDEIRKDWYNKLSKL